MDYDYHHEHGHGQYQAERYGGGHNESNGYNKHAGHSIEMFEKRFYVSLVLTVPVLILSSVIRQFLGFDINFSGSQYLLFLISSFIFFYGGGPFLAGAVAEIKNRAIGMMTLISLAIGVAYFYSSAVVFGLSGEVFFWELATLIDIMLLGHWIEMRSVTGAASALGKLSALIPDTAHLIKDGNVYEIVAAELRNGNVILVKPGEKIPADGIVAGGDSFANESMLTGESGPVSKLKGDKVIGGSINGDGALQVEVRGVGSSSYLNKVIDLVKKAQASKSKTQALADKAAFWLTMIAIAAGIATFISWLFIGRDIAFAIERAATVLVIACPHALGLAIPLVVAISTTRAAQNGFLIKNRTAFENARKISAVVFDKTGTLTLGNFGVKKIFSFDSNYPENEILRLFAGLEKNSEHPIAKAILKETQNRKITLPEAGKFTAIRGKGVEAMIEGKKMIAAGPAYAQELGLSIPESVKYAEGTIIFLIVTDPGSNRLVGAASLSDTIRDESFIAVRMLKKAGIKTWMLTGDNENAAREVADALGLDGYFAGALPDDKLAKITELKKKGEFIAMVGDGINDAPALAQADVGIAIGSGTDVAAETADIILVNSNPKDITSLILFGRATYAKMVQNLIWATGYNVLAIPLAAGVLLKYGILLSPALGAILMSLSTIIVAINARTLKINK